jgi:hypothetical protein
MTPLHSTVALVGRAVVLGDIRLGVCVDALLDHWLQRLVGLDVTSGDTAHRFLPFPACEVRADVLAVESSLVLLDRELDFYRIGGRAFSELRGLPVRVSGVEIGPLADLLVDDEGDVRTILASTPSGERELKPREGLVLGNHLLRPAV